MLYTINETQQSLRLDLFLTEQTHKTRSYVKKLIENGNALVNNKQVKAGYVLKLGDKLLLNLPEEKPTDILPENIPLDIVYEDSDLAVINKAQGMTVHPAGKLTSGTLVNAIMYHIKDLSSIGGVIRPGIVHRIDKDTSGLIVIAKNDFAHHALQKQIQDKTCFRIYRSVCHGIFSNEEGTISQNLARGKERHDKIFVVPKGQGRSATTHYKVLNQCGGYSYVEWKLETGRTHQIRVHASHMGHPICGDKLYGIKENFGLSGQLLHAYSLSFAHPTKNERMTFFAPLPKYFEEFLQKKNLI